MNRVIQTDIHSVVSARLASAITSITAGGAGDNTAIVGVVIDRQALGVPLNADLVLAFDATLAATATLALTAVKIEDSADGANWADYAVFTNPGVVATGPAGGGNVKGQLRLGVNLSSARRYIRVDFTPDLSAANTDKALVTALLVLAGFDALPSPA